MAVATARSRSPEKVVDVFRPPLVRVPARAPLLVTLPTPASDPTVSLKPFRSNVAPLDTVSALLEPMALAMPTLNVPALMVVAPE